MNTEYLSPLEFCILVMWVHGWKISSIHLSLAKRHGKSEHSVRGVINKLPVRRQEMSQPDRQTFLDDMKKARIDDGMLRDTCFVAQKLKSDQKSKATVPDERKAKAKTMSQPEPNPNTRAGRLELRKRRQDEEVRREKAAAAQALREAGFAPRGVESSPLEYLYNEKRLSNIEGEAGSADKTNNGMRRYEAGVRLRSMMESIYGSGIKSPDYESAGGGGGAGVVIHAVVAENINNIDSIKGLMPTESYFMLEQMLLHGLFVWQIPSSKGADIVLSEIRAALDKVSLFLGTMPAEDRDTEVPKRADREEVRQANYLARKIISKAQKEVR